MNQCKINVTDNEGRFKKEAFKKQQHDLNHDISLDIVLRYRAEQANTSYLWPSFFFRAFDIFYQIKNNSKK